MRLETQTAITTGGNYRWYVLTETGKIVSQGTSATKERAEVAAILNLENLARELKCT